MDTQQQGIISLIKSGITAQRYRLPDSFVLEDALPIVMKHHMLPLVYTGACYCGIDRESDTMQKMLMSYYQLLMKSEGQMQAIRQICTAFDDHGIDYMPVKGCILKDLYPTAELRSMGDADILIRMEQYPQIIPIMEALGFQAIKESDHELVWKSPNLYLELHKRLIPSYNRDFFAYFGDGWKLAVRKEGTRFSMTSEDEMIFLFTHFAKHFRDGGIGCRYVLDLWVFRRANPNMDEGYIKEELCKLQLYEFYRNILQLIDVWFEGAATDEKMDAMTEYIFASGSWGSVASRTISNAVRREAEENGRINAKWDYFKTYAFPGVQVLKFKYPILQKAPWMLPLVWVYRPFYKLIFERRSMERRVAQGQAIGTQDVDDRERMLRYMGLAYHFGADEDD